MIENDIFTNQKEVVENLRGSAQNLGVDPNRVVPPEPSMEKRQVLVARKNCKMCYGQGALTVAGFDTNKNRSNKPLISSSNAGTSLNGRNSRKPEPEEKVKTVMYCGCVKQITVDVPVQNTA